MLTQADFLSAEEIKKVLKLPQAKELGYVVHHEDEDLFLSGVEFSFGSAVYVWSASPELAEIMDFNIAVGMAIDYGKDSKVCHLFDKGKQLAVAVIQKKD